MAEKRVICEHCEEPIDPQRVAALREIKAPATLCLECARKSEARQKAIFAGIPTFPSLAAVEMVFVEAD